MFKYVINFISICSFLQPLVGNAATVAEVQEMLRDLGYSIGKADGRWGAKSREALKRFQTDRGLPVTGKIDVVTEKALQPPVVTTIPVAIEPPAATTIPVAPVAIETPVVTAPPVIKVPLNSMSIQDKIIESPAGITFVRVPGGCFTMGGGTFGTTQVCVHENSSFLISKYEVTQGQWKAVNGNNPSSHVAGADYPVENVSWNDVHEFIKKLSTLGHGKYRLPTEAEWEYSARGNTKSMYWWGETAPTCEPGHSNSANFNGDKKCADSTVKVGRYQPNAFGLYDVHGNVWEWVEDVYLLDGYKRYQQQNPVITTGSTERVFRGGSWLYPAAAMTVFNRDHAAENFQFSHLGFRLIYEPKGK